MFALLSSTEKCQYIIAAHNSYGRKVLVILSAENRQLIYLLASLTIASKNYHPLKRKPDGWDKNVYKEIYHSTTQNHGTVWLKTKELTFPNAIIFHLDFSSKDW